MNDKNNTALPYGHLPHPQPWPTGPEYDPSLLKSGDTRNVLDRYRYWTIDAIKADMAHRSDGLEIAIENVEHDFNIGTIVRSANAFNVSKVHIIGSKQWNKRGAMVTDRYLNVVYHRTVEDFLEATSDFIIIAIDNTKRSQILSAVTLPRQCVLVFGAEGPGVSNELLAGAAMTVAIEQFGSTRSINVGVAAGIVMYTWMQQHVLTSN